jgi:hypothetical protein
MAELEWHASLAMPCDAALSATSRSSAAFDSEEGYQFELDVVVASVLFANLQFLYAHTLGETVQRPTTCIHAPAQQYVPNIAEPGNCVH